MILLIFSVKNMCGIFGLVSGGRDVCVDLLEGLKILEYRGYDSSGIATINNKSEIEVCRATGKIVNLAQKYEESKIYGNIGISHTRWATHGKPLENNAHPHCSESFSLVHNGIIENFRDLKKSLEEKGYVFKSETDSETIVFLLEENYKTEKNIQKALRKTINLLEGSFALAIISKFDSKNIFVARRGSPLALGLADDVNYIASDAYAIAGKAKEICYLSDDDIGIVGNKEIEIYNKSGELVKRETIISSITKESVGKGKYKHFMLKEINEQPEVISNIMNTYCNREDNKIEFPKVDLDYKNIEQICFVACGSSYYSALIAKNWFESISNVSCKVEIASEFIYNDFVKKNDLMVFISQSGETADTLRVLRQASDNGIKTLVISNVKESSMSRIADYNINLLAGPEIGVASTKAFTAQLNILALIALEIAGEKSLLTSDEKREYARDLREQPRFLSESLKIEKDIKEIALKLRHINHILYLGRGVSHGLAHEAALKLKELSYIPAEGIAAGELKHGPIALIDEDLFIVAIVPNDNFLMKTISNLQEVDARGGKIIVITEEGIEDKFKEIASDIISIPKTNNFSSPITYAIPIQLLAYHIAVIKGTDVDQPRNLAKSVTVE